MLAMASRQYRSVSPSRLAGGRGVGGGVGSGGGNKPGGDGGKGKGKSGKDQKKDDKAKKEEPKKGDKDKKKESNDGARITRKLEFTPDSEFYKAIYSDGRTKEVKKGTCAECGKKDTEHEKLPNGKFKYCQVKQKVSQGQKRRAAAALKKAEGPEKAEGSSSPAK